MWIVPRAARPLDAESLSLSTAVRIASSSIPGCRYGIFGKVFPIFPPKGQVSLPEHWCGVITHFLPFLTTVVPRLADSRLRFSPIGMTCLRPTSECSNRFSMETSCLLT